MLIERRCENAPCGRVFTVAARRVRAGGGRFCSRACLSSWNARRQHQAHPEVGPANRNYKGGRSQHKRAYVDAWRARNPEKAAAHDAVRDAIDSGQLVKPVRCERCDAASPEPLHAHHANYLHPLAVTFVCRPCHRALDAERDRTNDPPVPEFTFAGPWFSSREAQLYCCNKSLKAFYQWRRRHGIIARNNGSVMKADLDRELKRRKPPRVIRPASLANLRKRRPAA